MTQLSIDKSNIPLWSGASGSVLVNMDIDPSAALQPTDKPMLDASFKVEGDRSISLGNASSVALGVKAGAHVSLAPLWKEQTGAAPDLVKQYDLGPGLTDKNLLLALSIGANADLSASGSFKYSVLTVGATLEAGIDGSLVEVRSFPRNTPFGEVVTDMFKQLRLPAKVTEPPKMGEVIALEYGGDLNFGISASAGYQMKGTKSFDVRDLKLSEVYELSVVGKLAASGKVAGRFVVEVRAAGDAETDKDWARVTVRRSRSKEFNLQADLKVGAKLDTQGLPETGKEFLGALIGVRAKNWLNLIDGAADKAGKIQSLDDLKKTLDGLAGDFITKYVGKAVDTLPKEEVAAVLGRLQKVVDSYKELDDRAIALFDRYFDPVLDKTSELETRITNIIRDFTSWDQLKGEIDPMLWNIVRQLTDGDPLGWALGKIPGTNENSLEEFRNRAIDTLRLIQNDAHEEIRKVIQLAKSQFGIDRFFKELENIDTTDKLKNALSLESRHFVERLLNQQLDKLNAKGIKEALKVVQAIVAKKDTFWQRFDQVLQEAASQKFEAALSASYASSSDAEELIDIDIRLRNADQTPSATGLTFMEAAGRGDFTTILAHYQPEVVRLREGKLTHNSEVASGIKINVAGWHRNFQYEEMYKVIVNSEQQMRVTSNGSLNVFTKIDMTADHERRRKTSKSEQSMHSHFVMAFLGETHNAEKGGKFDADTKRYLIDVITSQSASYKVTFADSDTTPEELSEAMLFAKTLGLDRAGATEGGLKPLLVLKNGDYGKITAEYQVTFVETGLVKLFKKTDMDLEKEIRKILARIVLANYCGDGPSMAEIAWAYVSDDVRKLYRDQPFPFINADHILGDALADGMIRVTSPIPGLLPGGISNRRDVRIRVADLFDTEGDMIDAFRRLQNVLSSAGAIKMEDFREALMSFGKVLNRFDNQSLGDNTTFAVFDGLIQLATPAAEARSSVLAMTIQRTDEEKNVVFRLDAVKSALAASGGGDHA